MPSCLQFEQELGGKAPWIVGVVNVTPDSFSDGGKFFSPSAAIDHGLRLLDEGAHILDLGAEASGPGSVPISADEEFHRLEPVVKALAPLAFVSIDTYKAETARRCLGLGAKMINDVSALRADPELAAVVAEFSACIVLMFNKEKSLPHVSGVERDYGDPVADITSELKARAKFARNAGINEKEIVLDPGMGRYLGKDDAVSWDVLARFDQLSNILAPYPLYLGISRKGFLGGRLEERDPISQLAAVLAVQKGASFIRTHNVRMAGEFFRVLDKFRC